MNCRNVLHLLSAYMDGELRGVEHRLVHGHLAVCPECEAEYQQLLNTKRLLSRMSLKMPREELSDLILQRITDEERRIAERRLTHWLPRLQNLLHDIMPHPRVVFAGTGLGIATAFLLAQILVPDEDRGIAWHTSQAAYAALPPAAAFPVGNDSMNQANPFQREQTAAEPIIIYPTHSSRSLFAPALPASPVNSRNDEGWDSRYLWNAVNFH